MLAQRCVGEAELAGEIGGGRRLDALQPFDDSALGVGQLGHPKHSTSEAPYFGSLRLANQCGEMRGMRRRL